VGLVARGGNFICGHHRFARAAYRRRECRGHARPFPPAIVLLGSAPSNTALHLTIRAFDQYRTSEHHAGSIGRRRYHGRQARSTTGGRGSQVSAKR